MSVNPRRIGLLINPVAGMGGCVGLKGTDGDMHVKALALGAQPVSATRVADFLARLPNPGRILWLCAPGAMGEEVLSDAGLGYEVIGRLGQASTADDTRRLASAMVEAGVEAIVFAGGDGTARDMIDAIDSRVPVIAIPAGVKVYSSVFAYSPRVAAELLDGYLDGTELSEHDVLDIDEDAFRAGRVDAKHYGFLLVPEVKHAIQAGKESSGGASTAEAKREIAQFVVDSMRPHVLYLLGSGTTVRAVANVLGVEKTLQGIDAVLNRELVATDLNEQAILSLLDSNPNAVLIVTPLGGNGFIFGRGNKQFTPAVIRRVGIENIVLIGNREKLFGVPTLHVDTGDPELDEELTGYMDVIVGREYTKIMKVQ